MIYSFKIGEMKNIPVYLLAFLLKIHRHSSEPNYFHYFLNKGDYITAMRRYHMIKELQRLGMIALTEKTEIRTDIVESKNWHLNSPPTLEGINHSFEYPTGFVLLPRGHYLVAEIICSAFGLIGWTAFVAALTAFVSSFF